MDPAILTDLGASGLTPNDLNAREVGPTELAVCSCAPGTRGYVIPYYDLEGNPIPFYRLRLFDSQNRYRQARGSSSQVYFPPRFLKVLNALKAKKDQKASNTQKVGENRSRGTPYVILTEGEKKAAAAISAGFPAVALGGVDSWRNRTIILPKDTKLQTSKSDTKLIKAKLPPAKDPFELLNTLAKGMQSLIDFLRANTLPLIIIYDTDKNTDTGIKMEVQRAAAMLAYELRYLGIDTSCIRQVILPIDPAGAQSKIGLDDFLVANGPEALEDLIVDALNRRSAFPRHPNPRAYVSSRLQKGHLNRKESQSVALAVLTEIDARGQRLISKSSNQPFFFDEDSHKLMPAGLLQKYGDPLHETTFGRYLYRQFSLSAADTKVITWLAAQYLGEPGVNTSEPKRILSLVKPTTTKVAVENPLEEIALQLSDSQFVVVSGDPDKPIEILNNGSKGILFEQDQVEPLDAEELLKEFNEQNSCQKIRPWWREITAEFNFQDGDTSRDHAAMLCYLSPFINRWRGTQLPIEIVTGEAGSGKSSVFGLRLSILTGRPLLRNIPTDLRDWHASIANTGGLHVIDNVHFTNKDLKQQLSDAMCRLTTEPHPFIEMRKLYTTSTQTRAPVNVTFAMTAIQQPFYNSDFIQRSAVFNLDALGEGKDGDWVVHQLSRFGGRLKWYAHQLVVLHRFLAASRDPAKWTPNYLATHRLAHYEQSLKVMAGVLGFDAANIAQTLQITTEQSLSRADWALEGLKVFAIYHYKTFKNAVFSTKHIVEWAMCQEDYMRNSQLTNTRSLGRYMQSHKNMIKLTTGITDKGTRANKRIFVVNTIKPN